MQINPDSHLHAWVLTLVSVPGMEIGEPNGTRDAQIPGYFIPTIVRTRPWAGLPD